MGGRLTIVGHGVVERQVLGPASLEGAPEALAVKVRRYRCRACRAVILVGPRGLLRRRLYSASAIALAFSRVARGETSASVRARTSPSRTVGGSATERWRTLTRWIEAARRGELFGVAGLGELDRRRVAEHIVLALAARAGRDLGDDLAASAFAGAVIGA